ncbi:hypothetical protein CEXT_519721 [Caerostris extrusa]|uniref:Uncharacterized protein n=1 Tax=Caerostris extrusa TaxID=172846 RepID=A0AAV4MUW1_CAEEX|nr:hypothetical protein CEXT_519721 [Caerostris extrusa]
MSLELRRGYFNNRPARLQLHKVILKNSLPVCGGVQGGVLFISLHFTSLPRFGTQLFLSFSSFKSKSFYSQLWQVQASHRDFNCRRMRLGPNPFTLSYGKCKPLTDCDFNCRRMRLG